MAPQLANTTNEYTKNVNLKKEDVEALLDWAKKQPHLPEVNGKTAILFLQSCYYKCETAKNVIDTYFTVKTLNSHLFKGKNPLSPLLRKALDNSLATILPKKTPQGYRIIFLKLMNTSVENFTFLEHIKYFDMTCTSQLYQEGTSEGYLIVLDMNGIAFGHLTKVAMAGPTVIKNFFIYLQEGLPIRLKGLHFINVVSFIDKVMALVRPFMKPEIIEMLHFHNNLDDLLEFVPLECLPKNYGGSVEDTVTLHEQIKNRLIENADLFEWEDNQNVDETKRQNKLQNLEGNFGIDGTFKKLEVD